MQYVNVTGNALSNASNRASDIASNIGSTSGNASSVVLPESATISTSNTSSTSQENMQHSKFSILQPSFAWARSQCRSQFFNDMFFELRTHPDFVENPDEAQLLFVEFDSMRQCLWPELKYVCNDAGVGRHTVHKTNFLSEITERTARKTSRLQHVDSPPGASCTWDSPNGVEVFVDTVKAYKSKVQQQPHNQAFVFLANVNGHGDNASERDIDKLRRTAVDIPFRIVGLDLQKSKLNRSTDVNILMPLLPGMRHKEISHEDRLACEPRQLLATFVGSNTNAVREKVYALHNRSTGIIATETSHRTMTTVHSHASAKLSLDMEELPISKLKKDMYGMKEQHGRHGEHGHKKAHLEAKGGECSFEAAARLHCPSPMWVLLKNSTFGFSPRGDDHYSFRLTETLASGAVPIVIDDDFTPPYGTHRMKDWAVWISEDSIERSPNFLRNMSEEKICEIRRHGEDAMQYARDMPGTVEGMLLGLRKTV